MSDDLPAQSYCLMLLRHAKSAWPDGVADINRPLGERGRKAAPLMGKYIARHKLVPDLALVSTAKRAQETWQLVASALSSEVAVENTRAIYEVGASQILSVLRATDPAVRTLLIVGHNPGMEDLAHELVGSGDADLRIRMADKFPTAALAVLEFEAVGWRELMPGGAKLARFVTPRSLD
ncbi:histidine phosphatase family protein [Sinorhizobium sp. NFACC03]|jgi:phosphohistidine phosphatase|uniref:SixA phosphatase family protein n=1 Tax=Sinorhizobium sp. NFACC03 TaxID=1566295 RepID=UPI00088FE537|nr:histidine phosphatase family protein [Sinorhizobium sp. NFACC03]SDA68427.1 phosphohistidine phosphatase [Sinorhizobium sp. NFACC03]